MFFGIGDDTLSRRDTRAMKAVFEFKRLFTGLMTLLVVILLAGLVTFKFINLSPTLSVISASTHMQDTTNTLAQTDGVTLRINQAAHFNHSHQIAIDYILVMTLSFLLVITVNYRYYLLPILAPPWFQMLKYRSRYKVSDGRTSNLQYKSHVKYRS
ncbi:hypothetical protein [Thalassotalea atypica]|uniref:hypothetical protein n=1 Tax=Thalassotalea atypica TaxID=2054316 RepID=UPI002572EDCB|nr:hypothetical protein [Thalassotalea atypica]